jgi:hypothetical protein
MDVWSYICNARGLEAGQFESQISGNMNTAVCLSARRRGGENFSRYMKAGPFEHPKPTDAGSLRLRGIYTRSPHRLNRLTEQWRIQGESIWACSSHRVYGSRSMGAAWILTTTLRHDESGGWLCGRPKYGRRPRMQGVCKYVVFGPALKRLYARRGVECCCDNMGDIKQETFVVGSSTAPLFGKYWIPNCNEHLLVTVVTT